MILLLILISIITKRSGILSLLIYSLTVIQLGMFTLVPVSILFVVFWILSFSFSLFPPNHSRNSNNNYHNNMVIIPEIIHANESAFRDMRSVPLLVLNSQNPSSSANRYVISNYLIFVIHLNLYR